jgi:hypothetical protein
MAKLQGVSDKADAVNGKSATVTILTKNITQYEEIFGDTGKSAGLFEAQNGGATGGRVDDLMGFAGGGIVPGQPPARKGVDNVLALVNGKPLKVRSGEWIINEDSSREYDRELAAINAGTFPKMPGFAGGGRPYREFTAQSFAAPAAGPVNVAAPSVTVMVGGEKLDQRMYSVASGVLSEADAQSQRMRRGRG